MVNNRYSQKLAIFSNYVYLRITMKNYKFILIVLGFLILVGFLIVIYLDIPAPDKLQTKILDVNDDQVK